MIPILGIALTLLVGLPAIAQNQIYVADLEQQLTELSVENCPKDSKSPSPGCSRRDK